MSVCPTVRLSVRPYERWDLENYKRYNTGISHADSRLFAQNNASVNNAKTRLAHAKNCSNYRQMKCAILITVALLLKCLYLPIA